MKYSKGHKKLEQILEDLRRDSVFVKSMSEVSKSKSPYTSDELKALYSVYKLYLDLLGYFRKEFLTPDKSYKLKKKLCKDYGIKPSLFSVLQYYSLKDYKIDAGQFDEKSIGDVCVIENPKDHDKPLDMHDFHTIIVDGIDKDVYPVHLKIHRFASKRDVLDFIDINWKQLKPHLVEKRIRQRKLPRRIVDFIWKHRELKAKAIVTLLKEEYPESGLTYFEVNKILDQERKRRKIK